MFNRNGRDRRREAGFGGMCTIIQPDTPFKPCQTKDCIICNGGENMKSEIDSQRNEKDLGDCQPLVRVGEVVGGQGGESEG